MPLLGQLVYTSFSGVGFKALASAQVPPQIQQAFIEQVVYQYWDSYNPPGFGFRAAYLYQVTHEQTLFGWLFNDGLDDLGRGHVPYFICYCLSEPLHVSQLEKIFTCLQRGPVALINRQCLPATLEPIFAPGSLDYQPIRRGVGIPLEVHKQGYAALQQGSLLDLFIPLDEQETVLNEQCQEQETGYWMQDRFFEYPEFVPSSGNRRYPEFIPCPSEDKAGTAELNQDTDLGSQVLNIL